MNILITGIHGVGKCLHPGMDQGNWKKRSRATGYGTTDPSWSGRPDEPQT